MSGRVRLLAVAAAALVAAAPAAAGVEIGGVDTSSFPTIHATIVSSAGASATPVVTENGRRVVGLDAENLGRAKAVVLAVDNSQSMAGKPLAAAAAAARSFVAAKPAADAIAVVEFGRRPDRAQRPLHGDDRRGHGAEPDHGSGTAGNGALRRDRRVLRSPAHELAPESRAHRPDGRPRRLQPRLARRGGRRRPRGKRLDLPDRRRGTGLRSPAAPAAGEPDGRPLLRRFVDERAHERVLLDRRPARPHVAHRVLDRRAAGGPDPRSGDGSGRRLGNVVRHRRGARRRHHRRAVGIEAPAVERVRLGRPVLIGLLAGVLAIGAFLLLLGARRGSWLRNRLAPHMGAASTKSRRRRDKTSLRTVILGATEKAFGHMRQWRAIQQMLDRGRHAAPRGGVLLHRRRRRAPGRDHGRAVRRPSDPRAGRDGRRRTRPVLRRVAADAAQARRIRDAAAGHADHDRGVAEGGPLVQAGPPGGRRRGPGARVRRVQARPHRDRPRPADRRRARRHGRARQLEELRVRDDRGHDPAAGRGLAREPLRPRRRHRAPAAAVRPQDPLAHGDGPHVGLHAIGLPFFLMLAISVLNPVTCTRCSTRRPDTCSSAWGS